jgi:dihydroneopterin aldolase
MKDIVFVKNCKVLAKHGYYKEEHSRPQTFVVSVFASIDTSEAGINDDLEKTLNYEHIRKYIYEVLESSPKSLVESLAYQIAEKVLAHEVTSVEVEIEKPDVWGDCVPGVKIFKKK